MRLIDADELQVKIASLSRLAKSDAQKSLLGRMLYIIDHTHVLIMQDEPLTSDELRVMVGDPVYDSLGQVWYIVESYYDHDLIMTDGTHFNDENKYARVNKRFYCNRPTIPVPQWISVEDEKPDIGQYVLVYHKDGNMQCAQYSRSGYDDRDLWGLDYYYEGQKEITHWMPLPEPPEEVRDE